MNSGKTPVISIAGSCPDITSETTLVLFLVEGPASLPAVPGLPRLSRLERLVTEREFKPERGARLFVTVPINGKPTRVLLIGVGTPEDVDFRGIVEAAATATRQAVERGLGGRLVIVAPQFEDQRRLAEAVSQGIVLGTYQNDFYQKKDEVPKKLDEVVLLSIATSEELDESIRKGRIVAESMNWARSLVDEPGAALPPAEFARRAAEMAAEFGLGVETLTGREIELKGMGGLWGVGKGSDNEPAMIVLKYEPENAPEDEVFGLIGKGITFDTGGISIKPAAGMEEMKGDMGGGAAVLGAMRAIAQLKPARRVIGVVPSAENMPSGRALKPGDVIRTLNGYTIEAVDTDAEGRLVLVDGIAYAKELGATKVIDLATLTGSIIVALGDHYTGLFTNNEQFAAKIKGAAAETGERMWQMPVSDDYKKLIESPIADFKNYGGRPDATGAALLLSKFAGETPWVHLDIAATAWRDEATSFSPSGATGAGIPTLVQLLTGED
jgi:leucyl aminopeptidase